MKMSTHNFPEANDSSWKVLVNATQRASVAEGHPRKRSSPPTVVKSYEEFVEELDQIKRDSKELPLHGNDHVGENCAEENFVNELGQENAYMLGDWDSDDKEITTDEEKDANNNESYKDSEKKCTRSKKYRNVMKNDSWSETSSSDDLDINYGDEHAFSHDQKENDWESLSSSSEDLNFEDFLKEIKNLREENDDSDFATKYLPYTSLTDCVIRQYHPESDPEPEPEQNHRPSKPRGKEFNDDDYNKEFTQNGKLKLEERLPLMQVIDVLEDVNKILKNGEITPNMERVLEYKQDYPFTEGYEEEKLGWCP